MTTLESILGLDRDSNFEYVLIFLSLLLILTVFVKVELGHILTLLVFCIIVITRSKQKTMDTSDNNFEIEYYLAGLSPDPKDTDYFYTDSDLIVLFWNIKENLSSYNHPAYTSAVKSANDLLRIRNEFEMDLCSEPVQPDLHKNFVKESDLDLKQDTECKSGLVNAYPMYLLAEERLKKCMNEIQSLIITLPATPVLHISHKNVCERLHILLKRNLDIIYREYKRKKSISDTVITDYNGAVAYNKYNTEPGTASDLFNFY